MNRAQRRASARLAKSATKSSFGAVSATNHDARAREVGDAPLGSLELVLRADRATDPTSARQLISSALSIAPDSGEVAWRAGQILDRMGAWSEAGELFERAARADTPHPAARASLTDVLLRMGRPEEAEVWIRQVLIETPGDALPLNLLAKIRKAMGDRPGAIAALSRAILDAPEYPFSYNGLGVIAQEEDRLIEAIEWYARAVAAEPTNAALLHNLAGALWRTGEADRAIPLFRRALAAKDATPVMNSGYLQALHYVDTDPALLAEEIRAVGARFPTQTRSSASFSNTRDPDRRLRVGYVSPDFTAGAVGRFTYPLVALSDRRRFETFGYFSGVPDAVTQAFRSSLDNWTDVSTLSDSELAQRIEADRLDILVDLSGHAGGNRPAVFARRSAPLQVGAIGWFNSTGLPAIDAIIADPVAILPGEEALYSEAIIVRLPHCRFCYSAMDEAPEVAPSPYTRNGHITFGSFNNVAKMTDVVIQVWADIVNAVPNSRLILKWKAFRDPGITNNIRSRFSAAGLSSDRIEPRADSNLITMLGEYADIDIALDPFPFTGGITSCDALWMGVPIITLAGRTMVSRQTTSFLNCVGLPGLVARDLDQYRRLAVDLASARDALSDIRRQLRPRMDASPLRDARAYTASIESVYRALWRDWCARS